MSQAIHFKGEPFTYETEANAGIGLTDGELWWGTLIKYRRGTAGKWTRFTLVDVHPFDPAKIQQGLRAYLQSKAC